MAPGALARTVEKATDGADLVVVDDVDHPPAAASELRRLLDRHPDARLLVTARSPLHLPGESVVRVPPLPDPDPGLDLESYAVHPAVRVFLDAAVRSGTTADLGGEALRDIAAICTCLGGVPRAIEMAAARTPALSPATLLRRLTSSTSAAVITSRGAGGDGEGENEGHGESEGDDHDLFHAIRWSTSLLSTPSRDLLAALAVFPATITLDGIEAVTAETADIHALSDLVDAHLLDATHDVDGSTYRLCPLVREHAFELLGADPERAARVRARHTAWVGAATRQQREGENPGTRPWRRTPVAARPGAKSHATDLASVSRLPEALTAREREVLSSMTTGATNKELSALLGISAKTVMHHTSSIYRKLGVRGRAEAVAWALRHPPGGDTTFDLGPTWAVRVEGLAGRQVGDGREWQLRAGGSRGVASDLRWTDG